MNAKLKVNPCFGWSLTNCGNQSVAFLESVYECANVLFFLFCVAPVFNISCKHREAICLLLFTLEHVAGVEACRLFRLCNLDTSWKWRHAVMSS
jgi:hypothetical protein